MPHAPDSSRWAAPRPAPGRPGPQPASPITYRPRPAPAAAPHVLTWLDVDERLRVDAAGTGVYAATHVDDLDALGRQVRAHPPDAVLVSVARLARGGRAAADALTALVQYAPRLLTVALVSVPVDLAAVLALGRLGIATVVDVQRADGWHALRTTLAAAARSDVAVLAARALAPATAALTPDVQRFVAALFDAPARVGTVRDLARGLGVLPTTLMSRFYRAQLPPPKRYLALARLTRAAHLLRAPAWTVAAVADQLEYSSAQGFSRHLHLLLGMRPAEFRRRHSADTMLGYFRDELLTPYAHTLRTFWPLRPGDAPGRDTPTHELPPPPAAG